MKNIVIVLAVFLLTSCMERYSQVLNSAKPTTQIQGNNRYEKRSFTIGHFNKVVLNGMGNIQYTQQAGAPSIEIYTSENLMGYLDIKVKDKTLYIGFKRHVNVKAKKLDIRITSSELNKAVLNGSGNITLNKGFRTNELKTIINGSGSIKGEKIHCGKLFTQVNGSGNVRISDMESAFVKACIDGSGNITLAGHTQKADYSINGSGNIKATSLKSQETSASVSGSGSMQCHAEEVLTAKVSGSGSIEYKGRPRTLNVSDTKRKIRAI